VTTLAVNVTITSLHNKPHDHALASRMTVVGERSAVYYPPLRRGIAVRIVSTHQPARSLLYVNSRLRSEPAGSTRSATADLTAEPMSDQEHMFAIDSKMLVVRQQIQRLEQRLRQERSIEWIAMVVGKSGDCGSMFQREVQGLEPAVQRSRSHLIDIRLQLAELGLYRDFPHAHGTDVDLVASIRDQYSGARWQQGIILQPPQEDVRVEQKTH
jgi:hypothetical protein